MILSRHPRSRNRRPSSAAHLVAGTLAVTATVTVLWGTPAASASVRHTHPHSRAHTASRSPHRGWVKYYIVRPPSHGHKEFLYEIAVKTLGHGSLAPEIFKLNRGRLQPGGGRLETPTAIQPGWILVLPAKASGQGVHYGPLPVVHPPAPAATSSPAPAATVSPTPPVIRHKPRPALSVARRSWSLPVSQRMTVAGGASLIVLLLAGGLAVVLRRRRKVAAGGRPSGQVTAPSAPAPAPQAGRPTTAQGEGGLQWPDYLAFSGRLAEPAGTEPDSATPTVVPDTAEAPAREYDLAFGDDRVHVVLAGTRSAADSEHRSNLAETPNLAWVPLPYDIPPDGPAFVCLGAGAEGYLFIDLAEAPGPVAISGDGPAAGRLAESIAHQLCTASVGRNCRVVVIGDALVTPQAATSIADLRDLGPTLRGPDDGMAVVFCQLGSGQDMSTLTRCASAAGYPVVLVVLATLPDAPWSLIARPALQPDAAGSPSSLDVVPGLA